MIPKIIHYCWLSNDPIPQKLKECMETWKEKLPVNGYHKSAVLLKTPIKKVNYDTIHKRIQRTGNFIV